MRFDTLPASTAVFGNFAVHEQFVRGKHVDPALCEDGILVSPDVVAVVDGATSKSALRFGGLAGGRFACRTLLTALAQLDVKASVSAQVRWLSDELRRATAQAVGQAFDELARVDRPTASLIYALPGRRLLVSIGDSQALLDGQSVTFVKKVDALNARARALVLESLLAQGHSVVELLHMNPEPGRQAILPLLKAATTFQNHPTSPLGFGVMDGSTVPNQYIQVRSLAGVRQVVLASDGYPMLHPRLQASEAALAAALQADPLCIRELCGTKALAPGLHSFDDRAYVSFELRD